VLTLQAWGPKSKPLYHKIYRKIRIFIHVLLLPILTAYPSSASCAGLVQLLLLTDQHGSYLPKVYTLFQGFTLGGVGVSSIGFGWIFFLL
jgi:hypothetical protein